MSIVNFFCIPGQTDHGAKKGFAFFRQGKTRMKISIDAYAVTFRRFGDLVNHKTTAARFNILGRTLPDNLWRCRVKDKGEDLPSLIAAQKIPERKIPGHNDKFGLAIL